MDAVIAILMVAILMGSFYLAGLHWWVWFWAGMTMLLISFELAAKIHTGRTLSQQFWAYSLSHKEGAIVLGIIVISGGIGLGVHLLWKLIKQLLV